MSLITIMAVERDGLDVRTMTIPIQINDESIDIQEAVQKACTFYANTEEGRRTFEYNCRSFNWADFESEVPNDICRKFGFEKVYQKDLTVDWDEQLVDESELIDEEDD